MEKKEISLNITASGLITNKPALVFAVQINSDAVGASYAVIYDGENATGQQKITIGAVTSDSKAFHSNSGIKCEKGIYVSLSENVRSFTIVFEHI